MALDYTVLSLLATPIVREVFRVVASSRLIRFDDLVRTSNESREQVQQALDQLKKASLVKERPSSIPDFATYYVTSTGLEASRKVGV